jgi:electron transfer flavoprotein alpha subunit
MVKVLVYSEDPSWARQLASASKDMGAEEKILFFVSREESIEELVRYFNKVYRAEAKVFEPVAVSKVVNDVAEKEGIRAFLFPCTNKGRMLAGLIAASREAQLAADVIKVSKEGEAYRVTKLTFGGNARVDVLLKEPLVLCIAAGAYKEAEPDVQGVVESISVPEPLGVEVSFQPRKVEGVSPEKAEVVVGAGRGIKKKEDLEMIKELADVLGGAWSVTRPLAADYGWADNWIGISGLIISPKLYIAVGISGQPHHMMGVRGAKVIVAINNDESAPIFEESDYGVIGDLYKVVPVLIKKLKERRG